MEETSNIQPAYAQALRRASYPTLNVQHPEKTIVRERTRKFRRFHVQFFF
jgi:hypothetical protein